MRKEICFKKWKNTRGQISQGTWSPCHPRSCDAAAGTRPPGKAAPANLGGGANSAVHLLGLLAELQGVARKWPWLFILYIPHLSSGFSFHITETREHYGHTPMEEQSPQIKWNIK